MCKRLEKINTLGLGFFEKINQYEYKSSNANAMVVTPPEFEEMLKESIRMEIPYLRNEMLKVHLPDIFQSEMILDKYKELAKYDHTILSNRITDEDVFLYDVMSENNIDVADLILSDSTIVYENSDDYIILLSQIETN